ncbi:right-handed parallel beta-helix repeat-containing protein [Ferruginibacter sp. HRS2-29]|uniref:right-handed parallel beta-helix repeat-containing protein n=1 Tax=Ferruginibacter sp. HRS2-29 TaxID=2487334 RepID=UPI0020CDB3C4|nr:right-handed parallel beta-helix repeat-containing protein [Ferruginibacter sp. HRS2-29]MCP9752521.1 hypothetical protein [Ferruginibacter sp. HRS2-29]
MKKKLLLLLLFFSIISASFANNFTTPGTGVKWSLDDLVVNSGGDVTGSGNLFLVNDTITISVNDTLSITTDATLQFFTATYLAVNGVLIIDPPTGVLFTAQNTATRYLGMRMDFSNGSILRKLTFEYANSLRIFDCSPVIDQCIFRLNSPLTSFGNGAISLTRSKALITNSQFVNNQRAAITGGANINNAPRIDNCLFQANNSLNGNVPQINMGPTGADTMFILNSQILDGPIMGGGIGFLPIGTVNAVVTGNIIKNNRYGIVFNGGSNINSLISYNVIEGNNIQNDPNLGGSGINFTGGSTAGAQNSIVTGNVIKDNLWGITIQGRTRPNLGNLLNADTSDNGKNRFINNNNATTPHTDLYNNTIDPISAQGNFWNTTTQAEIEDKIFHQPDNAALGLVDYADFTLPIGLVNLTANKVAENVVLQWQTATEGNSDRFEVEKSRDGNIFQKTGTVAAAGNSSSYRNYSFTDLFAATGTGTLFYRLKMIDKDNSFTYSPVVSVKVTTGNVLSKVYPAVINSASQLVIEINSSINQPAIIQFFSADGKLIATTRKALAKGFNRLTDISKAELPKGVILMRISTIDETRSFSIIQQ